MEKIRQGIFTKKSHVILISFALSLLILLSGYVYYRYEEMHIRREKQKQLESIAKLKVAQIAHWYQDELHDAEMIASNPFLKKQIINWLGNRTETNRAMVRRFINVLKTEHNLNDILLLSIEGQPFLHSEPDKVRVDSALIENIRLRYQQATSWSTDLYACATHKTIHIDFLATIRDDSNNPVAVIVFRIDPNVQIYPDIQSWPVPSKTSETLLVRQEGDSVLFLNHLRHRNDTALNFKISLQEKNVPAVQAVSGFEGIWEGIDYRGSEVLAQISPIKMTPWYLIAKVDKNEILEGLYETSIYIILFTFLFILMVVIGTVSVYNYRQRNMYKNLWETQEEYKTTLYSIGDAVITTDKKGIVKNLNPVAQKLTGWRESQAYGKKLEKVFRIINEYTQEPVENPVQKVLKQGMIVGLANHTLLISRDGREIPIADSGAPIKDKKGNIVGVVLVFSDQTTERTMLRQIADSEKKYRSLYNSIRDAILVADTNRNIIDCNRAFIDLFGYSFDEIKGKKTVTVYASEAEFEAMGRAIKDNFKGNEFLFTVHYKKKNGATFPGETNVFYLRDDEEKVLGFIGLIRDVSDRIASEKALRESEERFRTIFNQSPVGFFYYDTQGVITECNEAFVQIIGSSRDVLIGLNMPERLEDKAIIAAVNESLSSGYAYHEGLYKSVTAKKQTYVKAIFTGIRDHNNEILAGLGIIEDETKRKAAESALHESEQRFRSLVENAPDAIFVQTKHQFAYVNDACIRLLEAPSADDLIGKNVLDHFHSDYHEQVLERIRVLNEEQREVESTEEAMVTLKNKVIPVEVSAVPFEYKEQNGALVFVRDITERKQAEEAIIRSEQHYKYLFENNPVPMWVYDNQSLQFLMVNDAAVDHYGYSREEFLNMTIKEIRPEEDLKALEEDVARTTATINQAGIWRHKRKDGSIIFVEISSHRISYENRDARLVMARDMTARRRAEVKFQQIWRSAKDGMRLTDSNGIITAVNDAFCAMVGKERSQLVGNPLSIIYKRDRERILQKHCERFKKRTIPDIIENAFELHNGEVRWFEVANTFVDIPGEPPQVLAIFRDITKRKQSEAALLLRDKALNSAANAVLITDREGNIEWVNRAFTQLTGYREDEALGKNPSELLKSSKQDDAFYKELWQTILAGKVWRNELVNKRKDGTLYNEEETITPVYDQNGQIKHFIGIKTDISDKKKLEEQLRQSQKMEAVGKLAGGVAHDFNNLLTVINGYTDLLMATLKPENAMFDKLQQIRQAGQRATSLTDQLLAFSRRQVMQPVVLNLNDLIANTEKMLKRLIGEDIDLYTSLCSESTTIKADSGQIEQIIMNLAVNARDALPSGGKLTIETKRILLDEEYVKKHEGVKVGRYVMFAITDNGEGMDKETRQRIFEPFFTTKKTGEGTGLGLSTVYGIVKQSDGHIWVYSEPGKGTTFRIYLPAVEDEAEADVPKDDIKSRRSLRGSETILVVEDEDAVRTLVEESLQNYGYQLISASEGVQALKAAKSYTKTIHLLLTDVVMPNMSGKELAKKIHEIYPDIKICYMSGYTDNAIVRHGVLDKGVHLIQKPFSPPELAQKVREVLEGDV